MIWGRRASKDFLISIIALYEALKLLEVPEGDPYKYYHLDAGQTISILTVAASQSQAGIAFEQIRAKLLYSNYFRDKYIKEGIEAQRIWLLTPRDKEDNKNFLERGMPCLLKKSQVV